MGEAPALKLSDRLYDMGLTMGRLKTGTPPRLDGRTIDWEALSIQHGDVPPVPFSFLTDRIDREQVACHITFTNSETHAIIEKNLGNAPIFPVRSRAWARATAPRSRIRSCASRSATPIRSFSSRKD